MSENESKLPSYTAVSEVLGFSDQLASTSESHGLLSGLICTGQTEKMTAEMWASSVYDAAVLGAKDLRTQGNETVLKELFEVTREKLIALEFDFHPLLPNDETSLTTRAKELGYWCRGFLTGLGLGGMQLQDTYSEDMHDAVKRLTDIANIDYENVFMSEQDELAYMEVSEFVRFAALTVFAELAMEKNPTRKRPTEKLH